MSAPGRLCALLLLLSLTVRGAAHAQDAPSEDATSDIAPRRVEGAPANSRLPLVMTSVGLGLAGALVGGLAGTGVGVMQDIHECVVWCGSNVESHVPLARIVGASAGAMLGLIIAFKLQPDAPSAARPEHGTPLALAPLVQLSGSGAGVGLSGRF